MVDHKVFKKWFTAKQVRKVKQRKEYNIASSRTMNAYPVA
jgi:hypothetical protein